MNITPEIEAVKDAIKAKRSELIHLPLERIYDELAIAAVQALRVPTWRMQIEGRNALLLETEDDEYSPSTNETRDAYTAMIDAALGDNK